MPSEYRLLAVDIGNTETGIGFYEISHGQDLRLLRSLRFPTRRGTTSDLLFSFLAPHFPLPNRFALCSVVPPLISPWKALAASQTEGRCLVLEPEIVPDIAIEIDRPAEAGIDRIVNAWMGFRRYGGPLVVVDMGTATTFDIVSKEGSYRGGIIAPGMKISTEALASRTAKLPPIDFLPPERIIGTNTVAALRSGIVLGHEILVAGFLDRLAKEEGLSRAVATGGFSSTMSTDLKKRFLAVDPFLTLDGIAAIARHIFYQS
ncbi:MAG: type III pantothenate kinase [Candidatus Hydrogenedentota bacterium]|nr:MAG: type III pantothenate kinase [Candidatus Hydrogenedentota bacterium]